MEEEQKKKVGSRFRRFEMFLDDCDSKRLFLKDDPLILDIRKIIKKLDEKYKLRIYSVPKESWSSIHRTIDANEFMRIKQRMYQR